MSDLGLPEGSVVLSADRMNRFKDSLFELRCAAEDISSAVSEDADPDEIAELCTELIRLATALERLH